MLATIARTRAPASRATYSTVWRRGTVILSCKQLLDFRRVSRQRSTQGFLPIFSHEHDVLDAHAEIFFRDVNSRLDRDHHAGLERRIGIGSVVHFETHVMAQPVREVLAERLAMEILPVRIDVIVGDLVNAVW